VIMVSGPPGVNFILQASDDFVNWVNVLTNTAPCTWSDPAAPQHPWRMYRLQLAPIAPNLAPSYSAPVLQIRAGLDWFDDTLPVVAVEPPAVRQGYRGQWSDAPPAVLAKALVQT